MFYPTESFKAKEFLVRRKTLQETQNLPTYKPISNCTLQEQVMNESSQSELIPLHVNRVVPLLLHGQIAVSGLDFMGVYQNENYLLLKRKCDMETVSPTKRFKCSNCREIITCAGCGAFAKQSKRGRPKGSKNKMTKVERLHCNFEAAVKEEELMQHLNDIVPKGQMPRFRCISRPNISTNAHESTSFKYPNSIWSKDCQNKKVNVISEYSFFPTNCNDSIEIADKEILNNNNNEDNILEEFPEVLNLNDVNQCGTFDFDALDSILESLPLQNDNSRLITTPNNIDNLMNIEELSIEKTLDFTIVNSDEVSTKVPWYKSPEECKIIQNYGKVSKDQYESALDNQVNMMSKILRSVGEVCENRNVSMSAILKCHENKSI